MRIILLLLSLAGMVIFSQGLRIIDTVGMLASGVVAGASLAAMAAARKTPRRT